MHMRKIMIVILLAVGIVQAEEKSEAPEISRKMHTLQVNPLGPLLGSYAIDYELLLGQKHGVSLDLLYATGKDLGGNKLDGHGFTLSYRRHLQGRMESNFVGLFFRRSELDGDLKGDDERFSYHYRSLAIGPLYGERHIWKNGMCWTWKIGYGYPIFDFEWTSDRRPKHHGLIRGIMKWTTNIEAGASIGFAF